jgi:hypothetical protein
MTKKQHSKNDQEKLRIRKRGKEKEIGEETSLRKQTIKTRIATSFETEQRKPKAK